MNFFDLLFAVVFILIIVSNIAKQMKKTPKPTGQQPAETRTGWKKALDDILRDIREQMEAGAEPVTGGPKKGRLSWEDIIPAENENREVAAEQAQPQRVANARPTPAIETADIVEIRTLTPERDARIRRIEEIRLKKAGPGVMSMGIGQPETAVMPESGWSVEELKNAMIWHEILSPPLGLRDF